MSTGKLMDEAIFRGSHIIFMIELDQLLHKFTNDILNSFIHFLLW